MLFIYSMNDQIDENKHTESSKTDTNSVADLLFLSMQLKFQQFKKPQTSLSAVVSLYENVKNGCLVLALLIRPNTTMQDYKESL